MEPQLDLVREATTIVDSAREAGITIRILGGLAVYFRCMNAEGPCPRREFSDLDFVMYSEHASALADPMKRLGYHPNVRFNALYGARRLLYQNTATGTHFDVMLDKFQMCHTLSLVGRLEMDDYTINLADLLLTKVQIVQLTEKDLRDIYNLLTNFDLAEGPSKTAIDKTYVAEVCGKDWGWYRTVTQNLEGALRFGREDLPADEHKVLDARVRGIEAAIEAVEKPLSWKLRAVVGDKVRWYEIPEEPDTDRPV